jgi:hypothetical protein
LDHQEHLLPFGEPADMANEASNPLTGRAAEVCRRFSLGDEARALLRDDLAGQPFLARLAEHELFADAVRFLAYALPKREAVWWACQCARVVLDPEPPELLASALQAAERWAAMPTEDNRRSAFPAAEAAEFGTPPGCAALAAFWSGGSLAPPDLAPVPPPEHLTPSAVANAVLLAAVQKEPERAAEKFRQFLDLGLQVAEGRNCWPEEAPAAPSATVAATKPWPDSPRRSTWPPGPPKSGH